MGIRDPGTCPWPTKATTKPPIEPKEGPGQPKPVTMATELGGRTSPLAVAALVRLDAKLEGYAAVAIPK